MFGLVVFVFLVCGGLLFELLRLVPWLYDTVASVFSGWKS